MPDKAVTFFEAETGRLVRIGANAIPGSVDKYALAMYSALSGGGEELGTKVLVTASWASAAQAKADIISSLGVAFPADSAKWNIFVSLWEGYGDPDDYAVLLCTDTPAYVAPNGEAAAWTSTPTTGQVTVLGFVLQKTI